MALTRRQARTRPPVDEITAAARRALDHAERPTKEKQ